MDALQALQTREPANDLERRLVTENQILIGEPVEVEQAVKDMLGYEGMMQFDFTVERVVARDPSEPSKLYMVHFSMGQIPCHVVKGPSDEKFNHEEAKKLVEQYFVWNPAFKDKDFIKDNRYTIVHRQMTSPEYVRFDVLISGPEGRPVLVNNGVALGKTTFRASGHVFYQS